MADALIFLERLIKMMGDEYVVSAGLEEVTDGGTADVVTGLSKVLFCLAGTNTPSDGVAEGKATAVVKNATTITVSAAGATGVTILNWIAIGYSH